MTVAAITGVVATFVTGLGGSWDYAPSVGWVLASTVFVAWTWRAIGGMSPAQTASHATEEDPTTQATRLIVLGASVASLAGVGYLLVRAGSEAGTARGVAAALGVVSVAVSWLVVHTLFTLHYALLYYSEPVGGVDFNQAEPPRYTDFAYVSFTIGMTFQVSDTNLRTADIRASALRHALLSYLLGSLILAATVNFVVGLASGGH